MGNEMNDATNHGIRTALRVCLLLMIALPVGWGAPNAFAQSVLFEDSYFGSAGPNDMTERVVRPVMLDTYLPIDTSSWTTNQIACSESALRDAISAAGHRTVITFPPACTIRLTSGTGTYFWIHRDKDQLVIRGNADGRTRFVVDMPSAPPSDGWNHTLFAIGDVNPSTIASWSWDGGYAKGGQVLRSNQSVSQIYPGDIVRLEINQWTDANHGFRANHLVLCAQWSDGTRVGSDCSGVTGNNQIKIDRELPFEMTGVGFYAGRLSGHRIVHIERRGGGALDMNNLPMHIGIEDLTINHMHPMAVDAFASMIEIPGCMECWVSGVTASSWGNSWVGTGSGGQSGSSRIMVFGSDFEGPLWRMRCSAEVASVQRTNPVLVTLNTNSGCRTWGTGLEPGFWFPDDFPDAGLAGKIARVSCDESGTNCSGSGQVTVALFDAATSQPINGSGLSTNPGGWGVQVNTYGIAAFYFAGPVSHAQLINVSMTNVRVGLIQQQGAYETVAFGNYFTTDAEHQASRCLFTHGGPGSGSLWERNDCDTGFTSYASAAQGHGIGPYHTMLFNRGRDRGPRTGAMPDQCPGGSICIERTNQDGQSNDQMNFLGNYLYSITQGGTSTGGQPLDLCDNDGSGGSGPNCAMGGSQYPFIQNGMAWIRNVVWGESLGSDDFDNNPTTIKPDYQEGDDMNFRPSSWASTNWPTSLAYDRQIDTSPAWVAPSWWCEESGAFHNGMGAPADNRTGTYSKLPAQIRVEGGACTTPDGVINPARRPDAPVVR